jgi:hypothetical protein
VEVSYEYRLDSGPPLPLRAFVQRALDVTQSWYSEQRRHATL